MNKLATTLIIIFTIIFNLQTYPQTTFIVHASNYKFTPSDITVAPGDTVTWVWDEGTHTTTSDSTSGVDSWNAPLDQNHLTFSFVLTDPGVHNYHCIYHVNLGMVGSITVQQPSAVNNKQQNPISFRLDQNYPNPFNPVTEIKYSIEKTGLVQLNVYDILGIDIKTLINQEQSPGNYSVAFDGSNLPSGIYFYKLKTKNLSSTKKMILMK